MQVYGILNLTADSFSGGFLAQKRAIAHGERLLADGASGLDIGAEASNIKSTRVRAEDEIARLVPLVRHFLKAGAKLSIDTHKATVMQAMISEGVPLINDIKAAVSVRTQRVLAASDAQVVLMYSRGAASTRPRRSGLQAALAAFFGTRIDALVHAGISRDRLILDPGMGFFLGPDPKTSLDALRLIPWLKQRFSLPVYICTSRKSFIGALTQQPDPLRRGAGTLATELYALSQGADFVRTHDVRALRDAEALWRALQGKFPRS